MVAPNPAEGRGRALPQGVFVGGVVAFSFVRFFPRPDSLFTPASGPSAVVVVVLRWLGVDAASMIGKGRHCLGLGTTPNRLSDVVDG